GAEVDHDRGRAVPLPSRDRVCNPVGTDLSRVVVADRYSRLRPRPENEQTDVRCRREFLVRADQRRNGRSETDSVERGEIEQSSEKEAQLVAGALWFRGEPPASCQLAALEQAERCLRVSDVDCEQAGHGKSEATPLESQGRWPSSPCVGGAGGRVRFRKRRRTHAATVTEGTTSS